MTIQRPHVTVIIPTYNCSLYIKQSINSVLNQTLKNIEIIIIDDCSTDNTLKLIPISDKIKIIKNNCHLGAGKSRNYGLIHASGQFIAFLDGDDFYPNKTSLEKLYNTAILNGANIIGGSLFIIDEKTQLEIHNFPGQFFLESGFLKYSDYQHDGGFYRFLYRKDFLLSNNIFFRNLQRMQDPVFFVESMVASNYFYAIPDFVYAYRKNHKMVNWNAQSVTDKLIAISLILKISKVKKLPHLHYLMVKNFYNFFRNHLKEVGSFKNQASKFFKVFNNIDFNLLNSKWDSDIFEYTRLKFICSFLYSYISSIRGLK